MEQYSFLADLLESYRASPDIIKALWVLTPPGFVLVMAAILRVTRRPAPAVPAKSQRLYATAAEIDDVVLLRPEEMEALQGPLIEGDAARAPVSSR